MSVSIFNNFFCFFNIFFEAVVGTVEHNGSETAINTRFASFEICTMVEV